MTTTKIPGASPWEQNLYDRLVRHIDDEDDILRAYEQLASTTTSPAFAYLANLILADEERHHALLRDLAESMRTSAELTGEPTPVPGLGVFGDDADEIAALTERFLHLERDDDNQLRELQKSLKDVRDTTLWELLVRVIRHDNEKHRMILEFIRTRAREGI